MEIFPAQNTKKTKEPKKLNQILPERGKNLWSTKSCQNLLRFWQKKFWSHLSRKHFKDVVGQKLPITAYFVSSDQLEDKCSIAFTSFLTGSAEDSKVIVSNSCASDNQTKLKNQTGKALFEI